MLDAGDGVALAFDRQSEMDEAAPPWQAERLQSFWSRTNPSRARVGSVAFGLHPDLGLEVKPGFLVRLWNSRVLVNGSQHDFQYSARLTRTDDKAEGILFVPPRRHHARQRGAQCLEDHPPRRAIHAQLLRQQPLGSPGPSSLSDLASSKFLSL
jgi:hypothetical protein